MDYRRVREGGRRLSRSGTPEYHQLQYLRRLHRSGDTFGEVVLSGSGWRWTFVPAGVAFESPVTFSDRRSAEEALAALQWRLYPDWHCRGRREQRLQSLLREDEQREKVQALVEEELLSSVRKVVGNVYKHVRDTGRRLGDGAYLPRMGQEKREYLQLRYLRLLHRWGELTVQEYTLLAR